MTKDDLSMFVRARPFHPFEIRTVSGERYTVRSPEVMLSDTMIVISNNGGFLFLYNEAIESVKPLAGHSKRSG